MNCMTSRMPRRNSYDGVPPVQSRETRVVAIKGDPATATLDGQGSEPSVGDARPPCSCRNAQPREDRPMPLAGLHDFAVRLVQKVVTVGQGFADLTRMFEDPGIGHDPHHRTLRAVTRRTARRQGSTCPARACRWHALPCQFEKRRSAHWRRSVSLEPRNPFKVLRLVLGGGLAQIDPQALGGRLTAEDRVRFRSGTPTFTTRRNPSSIKAVSERPSEAALRWRSDKIIGEADGRCFRHMS